MKNLLKALAIPLLTASLVVACGDSSTDTSGAQEEADQLPAAEPGQVIATINGVELTVHELNAELNRIRLPADADLETVKNTVIRRLALRKLLEQKAVEDGIDRMPNVMMETMRSKSVILAQRYLQTQMVQKPEVSLSEAEQYVFDNPAIFAERQYYIFDSIIIPAGILSEEDKDNYETMANMDDIEKDLRDKDITSIRRPFTAFSENLPQAVLEQLPSLIRNKTVFFIVQRNQETITRFQTQRPAAITGSDAVDTARRILDRRRSAEYYQQVQNTLVANNEIIYLGEFDALNNAENLEDIELTDENVNESVLEDDGTDPGQ